MPRSSLVEFEVEIVVKVEVGFEDEVEVGVGAEIRFEVEVGGVGVWVGLTCSHVYYFRGLVGGWVGEEVKNRANLSKVRLKLRLSLAISPTIGQNRIMLCILPSVCKYQLFGRITYKIDRVCLKQTFLKIPEYGQQGIKYSLKR